MHPFIHSSIHSFMHSSICTHAFMNPFIHSFMHACTYEYVLKYSFVHSFVRSFVHSFIHFTGPTMTLLPIVRGRTEQGLELRLDKPKLGSFHQSDLRLLFEFNTVPPSSCDHGRWRRRHAEVWVTGQVALSRNRQEANTKLTIVIMQIDVFRAGTSASTK